MKIKITSMDKDEMGNDEPIRMCPFSSRIDDDPIKKIFELAIQIREKRRKFLMYPAILGVINFTVGFLNSNYSTKSTFDNIGMIVWVLTVGLFSIPCLILYQFWVEWYDDLRSPYVQLRWTTFHMFTDRKCNYQEVVKNEFWKRNLAVFCYTPCVLDICYVALITIHHVVLIIASLCFCYIKYMNSQHHNGFPAHVIFSSFCVFFCYPVLKKTVGTMQQLRKTKKVIEQAERGVDFYAEYPALSLC